MSVRDEIVDARFADGLKYGLIYTEVLGWVDLGHAQGSDIKELISKMNIGELSNNGDECYDVIYSQGMIGMKKKVSISRFVKWRIRKGRTLHERYSIALAMMLTIARRFESMQGSFPFNLVTDSGFSGEDLVSDLLGVLSCNNSSKSVRIIETSQQRGGIKTMGLLWANRVIQK